MSINSSLEKGDVLVSLKRRIAAAQEAHANPKPFGADFYSAMVAWGESFAKKSDATRR